jgi:predicted GIY-YIG superfamily endonuclease
MYFSIENAKEIKAEERAYKAWVRERKNHIISMTNVQRKQTAWRLLFPQVVSDDSYLSGTIF